MNRTVTLKWLPITGFVCLVFLGAFDCQAQARSLVLPGRVLEYPRDHGSHPEYPIEWWYATGHLRSTDPPKTKPYHYGFQITFFRVGLANTRADSPKERSKWHTRDLLISHIAITDEDDKSYCSAESVSRVDSITGAGRAEVGSLDVRERRNSLALRQGVMEASVSCKGKQLQITLVPSKPLVLHGDKGYVQKGALEGDASYYASYTRMNVRGVLGDGRTGAVSVEGSAWYDHEIVSSPLAHRDIGWDWFALQLSDGSDIMLYQLRDPSGGVSEYSRGAVVDIDGQVIQLKQSECKLTASDWWRSESSGTRYPIAWSLVCDAERARFDLEVAATVLPQEFNGESSTGKRYWEGRVLVKGRRDDGSVTGQGYMELVGYD